MTKATTVEVTAQTDIRESRRRMVSFPPGTYETTAGRAAKVAETGNASIVSGEKAQTPAPAESKPGKPGTTTTHDAVRG